MFKNTIRNILALVGIVAIAFVAIAGVDNPTMPTIGGLGILAETGINGGAGIPFAGFPVIIEADDTVAYTGPGGEVSLDNGVKACAVFGLSCFDAVYLEDGGVFAIAALDCTTAVADGDVIMAYCY